MIPGFEPHHPFDEVRATVEEADTRAVVLAPKRLDASKPVQVVVFATPNGNTVEQTLGSALDKNGDWRLDIQHIAAQSRFVRERMDHPNLCLVVAEAKGLSWPAWRANTPSAGEVANRLLNTWLAMLPGKEKEVTLTCHSGGGAFQWAVIEGAPALDRRIRRLAWLDANYSFDADKHTAKLVAWLRGDKRRELSVLAYDDRNITLDGKPVVSPTGGTYRATHRMVGAFGLGDKAETSDLWETFVAGQTDLRIHRNPQNQILHTRLVGEMNALMWLFDRRLPLREARLYRPWIAPPATATTWGGLVARDPALPGATAWLPGVRHLVREEREAATLGRIMAGDVPPFLSRMVPVRLWSGTDAIVVLVQPDVLSVGSDADFVRMPMTPMAAQTVADRTGCLLITDRISDAVHSQADVALEPRPLTLLREATSTFEQHHAIIEEQRARAPLGWLVAGHKKDVVLTNRLLERPERVGIYGWHYPDGKPIQPVYVGHVDWYVDYSHGIRLVSRRCWINGMEADLGETLRHAEHGKALASDGPLKLTSYDQRARAETG